MTDITIPTMDEITGHTVMTKIRSLIKSYIAFANEIKEMIDNIPTDVYDKEEIDDMLGDIDDAIDAINDVLPNKQDTLTAGANITILDNVISAVGASGSFAKIASGTLANDSYSITLSQTTKGFYIINIPSFGGIYIIDVPENLDSSIGVWSIPNLYYGRIAGSVEDIDVITRIWAIKQNNNLEFWLHYKYWDTSSTYYRGTMPATTAYEIYYIPISE